MSEKSLYEGLKKGDRKCILEIYDKHLPLVTQWVINNSGTKADAHDIFQETLETILLKVDKVHSSFDGLVVSISKRKWIDRLRKNASTKKNNAQLTYEQNLTEASSEEIRLSEIAYQKYVLMEKYFEQLSETCQKVITLLKQGYAVAEVVDLLSLSNANTLYRRKAACLARWSKLIKLDPAYSTLFL